MHTESKTGSLAAAVAALFEYNSRKTEVPMNAIKATWTNGRIVPSEAVDWPDGSELLVEPVPATEKIGLDESEWRDDADSIANWVAWVDTIEPLLLTEAERVEMERYRSEHRRFNVEAVRQQMNLGETS
jgi:hypothetical protein